MHSTKLARCSMMHRSLALDHGGCSKPLLLPCFFSNTGISWLQRLERATHSDRSTLNGKLGMFLKHFSEQWIKWSISSEVNRTGYFATRSYSTDRPCVNYPNHPSCEQGGTSTQQNTGLYLLLSTRKVVSFTHRNIWFLQWFVSVNKRALCKKRTNIIMLLLQEQ